MYGIYHTYILLDIHRTMDACGGGNLFYCNGRTTGERVAGWLAGLLQTSASRVVVVVGVVVGGLEEPVFPLLKVEPMGPNLMLEKMT